MINKLSPENKKLSTKQKFIDIKDRLIMSISRLFDMVKPKDNSPLKKDKVISLKKVKIPTGKKITIPTMSRSTIEKLSLVLVILLFSLFQLLMVTKFKEELLLLKQGLSSKEAATTNKVNKLDQLNKNLVNSLTQLKEKLETTIETNNNEKDTSKLQYQQQMKINTRDMARMSNRNTLLSSYISQIEVKFALKSDEVLKTLIKTPANNDRLTELSDKVTTLMQQYNKTNSTTKNYKGIDSYSYLMHGDSLPPFGRNSTDSMFAAGTDSEAPDLYLKKTSFNSLQEEVLTLKESVREVNNLMVKMNYKINVLDNSIIEIPTMVEGVHKGLLFQINHICSKYDRDMKEMSEEILTLNQKITSRSKSDSYGSQRDSEVNSKTEPITQTLLPSEITELRSDSGAEIGYEESEYTPVNVIEEEVSKEGSSLLVNNFKTFRITGSFSLGNLKYFKYSVLGMPNISRLVKLKYSRSLINENALKLKID